ncbi:hypothetical protein CWS35_04805 [Bradyrhizobium sp. SK17]|uniref:HEPN family nuclease n=1 Tax=Bradyrhizobium sp. SK17 TaxID=2057741 RepID=UPI000C3133F0|nr:HEPN family nuclease [Bradyrhizobium sp. SK17]AUC93698.1 hypothetical protein CWS35_04805 [Bradyrhizobium sp. SK17]
MTEYGVTVRHFAHRTRKNLMIIEKGAECAPTEHFEVTQLVNSAIGLLMFPQQEFVDSLPEWNLDELRRRGWPIPEIEHGEERTQNLRSLTRNMRNSFAHFNIDFRSDRGKIAGLYLWNKPEEKQPANWVCYICVADLRQLFEKFAQLMERLSRGSYSETGIKQIRSEIRNAAKGRR